MNPGKRKHAAATRAPDRPCVYRCGRCGLELPYSNPITGGVNCARCALTDASRAPMTLKEGPCPDAAPK